MTPHAWRVVVSQGRARGGDRGDGRFDWHARVLTKPKVQKLAMALCTLTTPGQHYSMWHCPLIAGTVHGRTVHARTDYSIQYTYPVVIQYLEKVVPCTDHSVGHSYVLRAIAYTA